MAIHQPALAPHSIPRWVEWALAVVIGAAIVVALLVVATNVKLGPQAATPAGQELIVYGRNGGAIRYTGIPYPAPQPAWIVEGRNGGGIIYTGIPYPPPGTK